MKKIIFGIGSGRCGTTSLSALLNAQKDSSISHEMGGKILLPWEFDEKALEKYLDKLLSRKEGIIGDVSFYLIKYIPKIIEIIPNCTIVVLKRNKQETVNSMMRKTTGLEHWKSNPKIKSRYDKCFPKFDSCHDKKKRIGLYYDHYYDLANSIKHEKICYLPTEKLNDKNVMKNIMSFCGIENSVFHARHLNRS